MTPGVEHLLLSQMSHRVLNELACAIGVLRRAERRCDHAPARAALMDACDRLHAFADLQRALSPTWAGGSADANCLEALCLAMSKTRLRDAGISVLLRSESAPLDADRRWRLNLLVSELLTNAARHAFDDDGGRIEVSVGDFGDMVICRVEDDGRGIGDQAPGRGLSIVEALAAQLQGRLTVTGSSVGTSAIVCFPRNNGGRFVAPQLRSVIDLPPN